jgi:ketosteroid isomerase-like protein
MTTSRKISDKPTTPDPVEVMRRVFEIGNQRDFDALVGFWSPDYVWDLSPMGLGVYEGASAIRGFFEDWLGAYEEFEAEPVEIHDLGGGVVFAVISQTARPVGSSGNVQFRYGAVAVWHAGMALRTTNYLDLDQARAAAERLAEERCDTRSTSPE